MTTPTPDTIKAALSYIPALLPRDEWARVGMSIKSEFPDEVGFDLFDGWSRGAGEAYSLKSTRDTWKSIKAGGGVTIATLIHLAKENGYQPPKPDKPTPPPDPATLERLKQERAQREQAEKAREALQSTSKRIVVTEITAASEFYLAEEYHQQYIAKNGGSSCHF